MKNPVENGIEMVLDNVQQLRTVINRIRGDSTQSTNPLTMKLNGTLDAAVNGGVSKFEVWHFVYKLALSDVYLNDSNTGIFYARILGSQPSLQTSNPKTEVVYGRIGMYTSCCLTYIAGVTDPYLRITVQSM